MATTEVTLNTDYILQVVSGGLEEATRLAEETVQGFQQICPSLSRTAAQSAQLQLYRGMRDLESCREGYDPRAVNVISKALYECWMSVHQRNTDKLTF